MKALDLRGFRSEGFFKKQKNKKKQKNRKKTKKTKKNKKNRKKTKKTKKCKKEKKRAKMSKKQHDFWLVCCGQERLFIFMLFCSWVGGGQGMPIIQAMLSSLSNCQLLSSVVNCYLVNEMQCFSFRTWSARSDWNDSTH